MTDREAAMEVAFGHQLARSGCLPPAVTLWTLVCQCFNRVCKWKLSRAQHSPLSLPVCDLEAVGWQRPSGRVQISPSLSLVAGVVSLTFSDHHLLWQEGALPFLV